MTSTSAHPFPAASIRTALIRPVPRTAVLVAVNVAAQSLPSPFGADGAIGEGLALFAVMVALSAVWGLVDGARRSILAAATPWLPTAALTAALSILCVSVAETIHLRQPLASALTGLELYVDLLPFLFGLVIVPAMLGALLGQLSRRSNGPPHARTSNAH